MREILDDVLALLDGGEDFALVKLIGDRGSTPRAAGAEMLVRRDGSIAGTIGGGLLELTMMKQAADVLGRARSRIVDLRLAGTGPGQRRGDGVRRQGGGAHRLRARRRSAPPGGADGGQGGASRPAPRVAVHAPAARGGRRRRHVSAAMTAERSVGAQCEPKALRTAVGKIAVHGSARLADGRDVRRRAGPGACRGHHLRRRARRPRRRAGGAGRRVRRHVLDDRRSSPTRGASPAPRSCSARFDEALRASGRGDAGYVVIVTRGHTHDIDVLLQALHTPARYIGLMASRSKRARIVEALRRGRLRRGRHRARALPNRPGHRRGDSGGARGQHRRGDDPGARRRVSLIRERPVGDRPGRRLLVAHGRAQAARRPPRATLLARAVGVFMSVGIDDVVVVTGHRGDEVAAAAEALGARPVPNPRFDDGMYTSVQAGAAAVGEGRRFFLLPVDCPLVRPRPPGGWHAPARRPAPRSSCRCTAASQATRRCWRRSCATRSWPASLPAASASCSPTGRSRRSACRWTTPARYTTRTRPGTWGTCGARSD